MRRTTRHLLLYTKSQARTPAAAKWGRTQFHNAHEHLGGNGLHPLDGLSGVTLELAREQQEWLAGILQRERVLKLC
jgi:hypothetical protein